MSGVLSAYRQRIARTQLLVGAGSIVLLICSFLRVATLVGPLDARGAAFLVGWIAMLGLFMSLVFGSWKIAWFVWRNPPAKGSDAVYIIAFSVWIVWTLFGAIFVAATHPGAVF
jgi:hypothetical protein